MTAYWVTLAVLCYFLWLARGMDPGLDYRPAGTLPTTTSSRVLICLAALLLIGVAGLRWQVGTDFGQYIANYEIYKSSFMADLKSFDEPGAKGLAALVSRIWDDPAVFIFAASAITIGLMLWTITRYSIALAVSYLLFVFVGSWHGSFNGLRQFLACAIVFAGHRLVIDRRPLRFGLVVALAASFHISALVALPMYFVPNRQLRRRMIIVLAMVAGAALYASDAVLNVVEFVKEGLTITDYVTNRVNPLRIAVAVAPVLLYWTPGVRTDDDGDWFYRNMAIVHAVVMLAASWSTNLGRFGIYTSVFLPLVIPRLVDFPDRRLTLLVRFGVVLLFAAFWYVEVSGSAALNDFEFSRLITGKSGA